MKTASLQIVRGKKHPAAQVKTSCFFFFFIFMEQRFSSDGTKELFHNYAVEYSKVSPVTANNFIFIPGYYVFRKSFLK